MLLSRARLLGHTGAMTDDGTRYATAPRLVKAGWLVHGFGLAGWGEEDLRTTAALRGFRPVIMRQLHSDIVHRLDSMPSGKLEGDALMTDVPGFLLVIRTADCLPVFLVDETLRAVAAVHCGWRGTQARILERTVSEMTRAYGTDPADLLAALGPCIGPNCYEVGPEVRNGFLRAGFPASIFVETRGGIPCPDNKTRDPEGRRHVLDAYVLSSSGRWLLDLRAANICLLGRLGVKPAAVWTSDACTHCEPDLLSYRRNKGESRRMYNFIGIRSI